MLSGPNRDEDWHTAFSIITSHPICNSFRWICAHTIYCATRPQNAIPVFLFISRTITRTSRASSFNDHAIWPLLRVHDSHVSGSLLVPGTLNSLSVASDPGSSFRLFLKLLLNPFATALSVVCRVPCPCSNATATQTLGSETKPLEHLSGEAHSPGDDWWVNTWLLGTPYVSPLCMLVNRYSH